MLNNVSIQGRLVAEPELRYTSSNTPVCSFCIANNKKRADKEQTYWIDCVAWRTTAEFICKYFHKGEQILITGELSTRNYETKDGKKVKATEIVVDTVDFCEGKKSSTSDAADDDTTPEFTELDDDVDDGDLPF